jgi:hypothetical protein
VKYVIWSAEHQAWWRPGRMGYAPAIDGAGHYAEDEAKQIVTRANIVHFHEVAIPVDAFRPSITCRQCGFTSYNANDILERYCGACHRFLAEMGE